jgi:AraC-like DNA-binding protein
MDARISNTISFIESNLDKRIDLKLLSDVACLSPVHFHRYFKLIVGCTPIHFVESEKIKKALTLIRTMDYRVQDISEILGYENYETFTRSFTKHCQIAPGDLREIIAFLQASDRKDKPTILSFSRNEHDLMHLLQEGLNLKVISPGDIDTLQVCIISPLDRIKRSRNIQSKFSLSIDPILAEKLLNALKAL